MRYRSCFFGDPQTPLHLATYLNLTPVVKDLVEKGASLELQDQDGNTALHVACQRGQTECATEMTRNISPSKLEPVLVTQNWRGELGDGATASLGFGRNVNKARGLTMNFPSHCYP